MSDAYDGFAPELLVEARGAVRLLTINRPQLLNAVDLALHDALAEVWAALGADADARAVVITGAGRAFCAGGDLAHIRNLAADPALRRADMTKAAQLVRSMLGCPLPVIAAVNGPAVGLGATVALLADIVLMSDTAYLSDPHVSVGLTAADGGASVWPLVMPLSRAKEFLFTGDRIRAAEAEAMGLANHVVVGDELVAAAVALAQRLAAQPRQALASTKRALNMHLDHAIGPILDAALEAEFKCFDDPEHHAAIARLAQD